MRIFVTGVCGQLGFDVVRVLKNKGHEVIGSDIHNRADTDYVMLDITNKQKVREAIISIKPEVVIHCAAWTNVDSAEDSNNVGLVKSINYIGSENIALVCRDIDAKMVYISTDYVFNGTGVQPWRVADPQDPINTYGMSKLLGELAVKRILKNQFTIRVSWVFGINGKNFVKTMINVGKTHSSVRVVNDQIGSPTYTFDLANLISEMIETDNYGVYHATNEGDYISWYDFCKEFYRQYGLNTEVIPVSTEEYGLNVAKRPYNSRLDKSKLKSEGFNPLPDWQDAVSRYLKEASVSLGK